ncbi:MAG: NAD(P) transhydrogenase subunit alpha [Phycisphaerales bacterium]|nr:NAD(P) transhydrogenase subunit alpha [Phycisphaerales bacterium]
MLDRRRLRWIAPLLLVGLWPAGCGNDTTSTPESDKGSPPAAAKGGGEDASKPQQPGDTEHKPGDAEHKPGDAEHKVGDATQSAPAAGSTQAPPPAGHGASGDAGLDFMSMLFVFMLATFIGIGVIRRVSRLLHTPLMSLTNAISAIAVVGSIMVTGSTHYPGWIRFMGGVALFASMTNIVSGFLITDRMLKMFKTREAGK